MTGSYVRVWKKITCNCLLAELVGDGGGVGRFGGRCSGSGGGGFGGGGGVAGGV